MADDDGRNSDDDSFLGDAGGDGSGDELGSGAYRDFAALMRAAQEAAARLSAEGMTGAVDIGSIQRLQGLHGDEGEGSAGEDGDEDGNGDGGSSGDEDADHSTAAPEMDGPAAAVARRKPRASATRHVSYADADMDDFDMGFMPEALVSEDDSNYMGSDDLPTTDDETEMASFQDTLRATAGFRRKRGGGKKRPPRRKEPVYSHTVQILLGEANQLFVQRELDQAFRVLSQVVCEDGTCAQAWATMALIRKEQGRISDAAGLYAVAAHLSNEVQLWEQQYHIHMEIAQANGGDQAAAGAYRESIKQALYCLSMMLRKNPRHENAWRWRLGAMELIGDHSGMARTYRMMLRAEPHKMEIIQMASMLFAKHRKDLETPLKWYADAFAFYEQHALELTDRVERAGSRTRAARDDDDDDDDDGDDKSEDGDQDDDVNVAAEWREYIAKKPARTIPMEGLGGYTYSDVNMAAELRIWRCEHAEAIVDIKRGARFIQGRGRESEWVGRELEDETDAEYDTNLLPIELRVRLGQCRLLLGQHESAWKHIVPLLEQDVVAYEDLYTEIADTYLEVGMCAQALEVYEKLTARPETNQPWVWERLARCHRELGDLQRASQLAAAVVEADPNDTDMRLWLSEVYQEMGQEDLAYEMVNVAEDIQLADRLRHAVAVEAHKQEHPAQEHQRPDGAHVEASTGLVQISERKTSEIAQRRRHEAETERQLCLTAMRMAEVSFKKLDLLRSQIDVRRSAAGEYCAVAKRLFLDWRSIRAFYLSDRSRPFHTYRNIVMTNLERDAQSGEIGPLAEASGQAAVRRQLDRMKRQLARQKRPQNAEEEDDDGGGGGSSSSTRPTTFRGQSFERWFDMFLVYAKCLTLEGRVAEAEDLLDVICDSSVYFHDPVRKCTLRLMMLVVALRDGGRDRLYDLLRTLCGPHPRRAMRYKLYAFSMATSAAAAAKLSSSNAYKFVRRQLDQVDDLYYKNGHQPGVPLAPDQPPMQWAEDDSGAAATERLAKSDVAALHSLAGHMMLGSRTGSASLVQYTLALSLAPQDASVALHLGVAYLVHSARREAISPQAMVLRGLAFVQRYAELRCMHELRAAGRPAQADVVVTQEIAYNLGRAFHFVGLPDLAIAYYRRVFELPVSLADSAATASSPPPAYSDLKREAAYNLASIYATSGSVLRARAILAEHCTIV
ncbi:transcription factor TFIIIC subunit tfc4 [Coemansia javaensis]|uniref:Transcription factor TFIIIC subunit tfc4 n=1 Tax=Coemansia javaensis TaxID=2761396 RepID=A0A9W8HI98_9FUNG|nr:transcription factor TFIIIC subunit tfc4 [Coemansia javaensis]